MQIVTGRRGEPHVTSRQMQAVYRSFLGDFALLDIGEKLRAEAYSNDIVRVYDGVVSVQGIYAVIAYNQYDEVYIEPVSVGKKRIDTIVLHYTKDNALDVEDMQLDVVQGEEYTDNPIAPVVPEGGDAWEGTTDIQVPIYDVEVTNFGLTVTPYARMLNLIPTLESIAERIPETVVTGVKGDSEVLYRDGDVNITKANIGLGNVDNTADTDKPISTATQTALNAGLAGKVDKVAGKGLSTEDYTTTDKTKLAGISEGATQTIANPADTATETLSKLEVGGVVYDVPQGTTGATNLSELNDVNLSGTAEGDILEYDSTANKWKNSNALQGAKTATGNPLTVTDAAPVNAVNLSMDLEPIQDLHGYDHPWVGGAGKNKLPMTVDGIKSANTSGSWSGNTYTVNGVTFTILTDSDGNVTGIKANGTASAALDFYFAKGSITVPDNAVFSTNVTKVTGFDEYIGSIGITSGYNYVSLPSGIYTNCGLYLTSGYTANNLLFKPMIRLATETDSSFAPYTNICPISGRSEVAIQRVGKNLINNTATTTTTGGVTYTVNQDKTISCSNTSTGTSNITIISNATLKAGNYILTGCPNGGGMETMRLHAYRTNGGYLGFDIGSGAEFTLENDINDLNVEIRIGSGVNTNGIIFKPMIRLASDTDSAYEPYAGKTYTIQIGQTVYGGQLDVTRGKMVVTKGIERVDDSWIYSSYGGKNYIRKTIEDIYTDTPRVDPISSMCQFGGYGGASIFQDGNIYQGTDGSANVIYLSNNNYTNKTDFLNVYAGCEIVYELAEPFTIDLTPTQIKMLENTNTIYTDYDGDTITLEYQPNNAIGEAVRAVEESYDPEFAVRPVLKKKAFSGTTDSDGSVTLINASDIPINHRIIPLHITDMTIGGSAGTYFVEYKPYNSGDSVKGYCYSYYNGSQITPVGSAVTGNFYYYELEV